MDCFRHSSSVPSFSFIDPNQVSELDMNFQSIMGDNFFSHHLSSDFSDVAGIFQHVAGDNLEINNVPNVVVVKSEEETHETKKRKAGDVSPATSSLGKNSSRGGKKGKMNEKEEEKLGREVVHVRARRGQATDSHSLAERARRGKINERLKCLQDIVPGCYKTMGMAVMLDEIINYVQSLQNQVEFLSMKLTAASSFHDFNSDSNAIEMMQRGKAEETEEMMREGYGGDSSCFNSTSRWPH